MRVSSGLMMGRYVKQINKSYENQAKLMEQSDGSNLHRPSDDSVKYSKYLRYQNSNTENLQYQDNVKAGISWMRTADAAAVNMTEIYTTLKEKTIDAANDTNGELDLKAIAKEFKAKLYEIVSLGNTQQGDRYVFSGQSDLTQPFVVSVEEKDRGLAKTLDDPQAAFFTNPVDTSLNVSDAGSLKQMLTLNGSDGNTYYLNTMNGNIYTEDFIMNGYKDKVAAGQSSVAAGDEAGTIADFAPGATQKKVSDYFENTGVIREFSVTITNSSGGTSTSSIGFGKPLQLATGETATATTDVFVTDTVTGATRTVAAGNTISLGANETAVVGVPLSASVTDSNGTTTQVTFDFALVHQPIVSYEGDARYISMVKLNGSVDQTADTVNLTGQDLNGSDIFDDANSGNQTTLMSNGTLCYVSSGTALLNNMFTVCAKMEDANNRWMTTDGITIADMSHSTVVTAQSSTAARQNVYDSVDSTLDKQNEAITSDLNDVSATDVAELAVKLMAAQTIYNMSLSVGSRILPPSLADYL